MSECENLYNKFSALKNGIEKISDYLVENSQDLFKLMYYIEPSQSPLSEPDLTNAQKAAMICSDAISMYDVNSTSRKNIIYQIDIDEAYWIAQPQIRMEVGDFIPVDSYRGYAEINFLIVVPNTQRLFTDGANTLADRSVAMALEIIRLLNGTTLTESGFYSAPFMNRSANNGAGRSTGSRRIRLNDRYSGYLLSMAVWL